MAETFSLSELVIPGTYIGVRAEGLISVGGVSTGNIGIVGTSANAVPDTQIIDSFEKGRTIYGPYAAGDMGLTRSLELLFMSGASNIYARALAVADAAAQDKYTAAFNELIKDDVNILVAPQLATKDALAVLSAIAGSAETAGKDVIVVVGSDVAASDPKQLENIKKQVVGNPRIILAAPGIKAFDSAAKAVVDLPGNMTAASVAGLISSLTPQSSPTNKVVPGVMQLAQRFSYGEKIDLTNGNVMVLEERLGVRVVRGLTTDAGAFKQVTTRRITDFAKAGIRLASNPFIGKLNNQRVRAALHGAINGFLTTMVQDEALIGYSLLVTATRDDEIAGRAIVNAVLQPTFSIDFVAVTLYLQ